MQTLAVLPIKQLTAVKRRLSDVLGPAERSELMCELAVIALRATADASMIDGTLVITADPQIGELAVPYGAEVISDEGANSHSQAAAIGVTEAKKRGASRAVLIAGDCPLLNGEAIDLLVRSAPAGSHSVVVAADRHGTGTNALLLTPPDAITPAFGPDSCAEHRRCSERAGASCRIVQIPEFELDIDTEGDLHLWSVEWVAQT